MKGGGEKEVGKEGPWLPWGKSCSSCVGSRSRQLSVRGELPYLQFSGSPAMPGDCRARMGPSRGLSLCLAPGQDAGPNGEDGVVPQPLID